MSLDPGSLLREVKGNSPIHRAPLALKYVVLAVLGVGSALWRTDWPYGLGLLLLSLILYAVAGRSCLRTWATPLRWWWWVIPLLLIYHGIVNGVVVGLSVISCIFALLTLARLLLLTTDTQVLIDGVGTAASWLRIPRSTTEIAMALFLRTLPDLVGTWRRIRESAQARGLPRAPLRTATALVIAAVARARDAGDALSARGLPAEAEESRD